VTGPVQMRGEALMSDGVPLTEWFATRWWEADAINAAVMVSLADWPWTGPVTPVALIPNDQGGRWRLRLLSRTTAPTASDFPLAWNGIAIRPTGQARHLVTAMPAPLGRLAAAQLAAVLEELCPPAGVRD